MDFWIRVQDELIRQGKNFSWLGKTVSVPKSTISIWRVQKKYPNAEKAVLIARAVGRSVEYLVTGIEATGLSDEALEIANAVDQMSAKWKKIAYTQVKDLQAHYYKAKKK